MIRAGFVVPSTAPGACITKVADVKDAGGRSMTITSKGTRIG